jgi:hypothetical protein
MPPPRLIRRTSPFVNGFKNLINHGMENFGRYYSIYRAWVFENKDPEGLGRLKLIIPQVTGPSVHNVWAYPIGVPSAEGFGSQIIPPRGGVVWVQFEGGSPEVPVWSHGHFAKKEIPKDDSDLKDTNVYWFITKAGHKIKINDTKNTIHIQSSTGQLVILNDKGISHVSKDAISLGSLNVSAQPAVLGQSLMEVLLDMKSVMETLNNAMVLDKTLLLTRGLVNMSNAAIPIKTVLKSLTGKIDKILSKLVTLD